MSFNSDEITVTLASFTLHWTSLESHFNYCRRLLPRKLGSRETTVFYHSFGRQVRRVIRYNVDVFLWAIYTCDFVPCDGHLAVCV